MAAVLLSTVMGSAAAEGPDVLVISAMDDPGTWQNGPFSPHVVSEEGRTCLVFDFGEGGHGEWNLASFAGMEADLDSYDVLAFDFRVEGGGVNINTNMRKWPWFGGYIGMFYQVDDHPWRPRRWVTERAGMHSVENAWRGTFSRDKPLFSLALSGAADPGQSLRVYIDNIRAVRFPVTVDCIEDVYLLFGDREDRADGGLQYHFPLILRNHRDQTVAATLDLDTQGLKHFAATPPPNTRVTIPANGSVTVTAALTLSAEDRDRLPSAYAERAVVHVVPDGREDLTYSVALQAAVPHSLSEHPALFATRAQIERARQWQERWGWARDAATVYVDRAEFAMKIPLEMPAFEFREEQPGDRVCSDCGDATELFTFPRADSVFRFQCVACGNMLSPKLYPLRETSAWAFQDDGYWWHPTRPNDRNPDPAHAITFNRAGNVLDLAVAWHLTGETRYRDRAADVLAAYAQLLPTYPFVREHGSIQYVFFDAKGAFRVGNYFSQQGWLHRMACTLDLLWDSGVITDHVKQTLLAELRRMAIVRLRMINTGSHRLNEALAAVALLSDDANLLAFALNDPRMGARPMLDFTLFDDGMNNMAGQYQEPVMAAWMPVLNTYRNAGIDLPAEFPGLRRYAVSIQQWLNPEGRSPSLGDASAAASLRNEDHMEMGYAWFGDPDIIRGVQRRMFAQWQSSERRDPWESLPRQGGNPVLERGAALFRGVENIPRANPEPFHGSYNFPDYGLLVFNQGEGDRQLWAAMPYGPPLGHGHRDNLHLEWWALGQTLSVKQGSRGRHHAVHHNTLLVDGKDQSKVPCDLVEWVGDGPVQGAVLVSEALYPGTRLSRTILLYDGLIFLFDTFDSDTERLYDMVYANAGTLHSDLPFAPMDGPLGTTRSPRGFPTGYAALEDPQQAPPPERLQIVWDNLLEPDRRVRMTQISLGEPGAILQVRAPKVVADWQRITADPEAAGYARLARNADAGADRSDFMAPKLIRRIHARKARLLTILEPYRGDSPRLEAIEALPLTLDGKATDAGLVLRYQADGVTHQVILCPEPGVKAGAGWTTSHRFTAGAFGSLR